MPKEDSTIALASSTDTIRFFMFPPPYEKEYIYFIPSSHVCGCTALGSKGYYTTTLPK
jgi:hypothetical protein